jgi:hypothetical protein
MTSKAADLQAQQCECPILPSTFLTARLSSQTWQELLTMASTIRTPLSVSIQIGKYPPLIYRNTRKSINSDPQLPYLAHPTTPYLSKIIYQIEVAAALGRYGSDDGDRRTPACPAAEIAVTKMDAAVKSWANYPQEFYSDDAASSR